MASAKKIAANKRNAARSTGPRSAAGRRRVSRNAYRHGLSQSVTSLSQFNEELDKRAHELAEGLRDPLTLENARTIAEAELDISRARLAKISLIERAYAFGAIHPPRFTTRAIKRWLKAFDAGLDPPVSLAMEGVPDQMPSEEPDRTAEAVRRALPELLKLDRYERRAAARRDRAVRQLFRARREEGSFGKTKPNYLAGSTSEPRN
jgi:hypothetical protein